MHSLICIYFELNFSQAKIRNSEIFRFWILTFQINWTIVYAGWKTDITRSLIPGPFVKWFLHLFDLNENTFKAVVALKKILLLTIINHFVSFHEFSKTSGPHTFLCKRKNSENPFLHLHYKSLSRHMILRRNALEGSVTGDLVDRPNRCDKQNTILVRSKNTSNGWMIKDLLIIQFDILSFENESSLFERT